METDSPQNNSSFLAGHLNYNWERWLPKVRTELIVQSPYTLPVKMPAENSVCRNRLLVGNTHTLLAQLSVPPAEDGNFQLLQTWADLKKNNLTFKCSITHPCSYSSKTSHLLCRSVAQYLWLARCIQMGILPLSCTFSLSLIHTQRSWDPVQPLLSQTI